jgi:hypothetical protein
MPSLQIAVTMYAPLYVNSLQCQRRENPDSRTFTVTVQRIRDHEKCTYFFNSRSGMSRSYCHLKLILKFYDLLNKFQMREHKKTCSMCRCFHIYFIICRTLHDQGLHTFLPRPTCSRLFSLEIQLAG